MQFPTATLTAFALAAAALVSAAPAPVSQPAPSQDWKRAPHPVDTTGYTPIGDAPIAARSEGSIQKRTSGGVYVCQAFGFTGSCAKWVLGNYQCNYVNAPWSTTISSVGPDSGTACAVYQSTDCSWGGSQTISNPGGDLNGGTDNYWAQFNDNVKSIKCWF